MAKKTNVEPESATTQVNIADFQRTRDSVIVALATLQSSVQELSRAYINHANTVLAPGRGGALDSNLTNILTESGLLTGGAAAAATMPAVEAVVEEGKKKRKRVPHDPNAPKRALTPYFLYMQHARAQIAKELGDQARPKEVSDEGTRRWSEMSPAEKSVWDDKYQKNLAAYRVRMAAYKAGERVPDDAEALRMVEAGKAPAHVPGVDDDDSEDAAAGAAKEAAPKAKRRKSDKKAEDATPKETPKAKKDKKSAKKEASPAPASAKAAASDKKKKSSKKA